MNHFAEGICVRHRQLIHAFSAHHKLHVLLFLQKNQLVLAYIDEQLDLMMLSQLYREIFDCALTGAIEVQQGQQMTGLHQNNHPVV